MSSLPGGTFERVHERSSAILYSTPGIRLEEASFLCFQLNAIETDLVVIGPSPEQSNLGSTVIASVMMLRIKQ